MINGNLWQSLKINLTTDSERAKFEPYLIAFTRCFIEIFVSLAPPSLVSITKNLHNGTKEISK